MRRVGIVVALGLIASAALLVCAELATPPTTVELVTGAAAARFDAEGAHLRAGAHAVGLRAASIGRSGAMHALDPVAPEREAGVVRFTRGAMVEWWRALPSGLEHGFTLGERPEGHGELVIQLAIEGLCARTLDTRGVELVTASGDRAATYSGLVVADADGRSLPTRLASTGDGVRIEVDDAGARYPIVIDPLFAAVEATLTQALGGGPEVGDLFGAGVDLSGAGDIALFGAPADDASASVLDAGLVSDFRRTGTAWASAAMLRPGSRNPTAWFGYSLAISDDGSRAIVGAYLDDNGGTDAGSAYLLRRAGTAWIVESSYGGQPGDWFGLSVDISADGSHAVVGAPKHNGTATNSGGVYIYTRTSGSWALQASLTPTAAVGGLFGYAVAISGDDQRVIASSYGLSEVAVYRSVGTAWTNEYTNSRTIGDGYGGAVAIDALGSVAVVGAHSDDLGGVDAGTAWLLTKTSSSWSSRLLAQPTVAAGDHYGSAVAVSGDGTRIVVGAPEADPGGASNAGAAYLFTWSATSVDLEQTLLHPTAAAGDRFGTSVSLSSDGRRVAVGAPNHDPGGVDAAGSAVVFFVRDQGDACTADAECASGFCRDAVCCESDCGGGLGDDCRACSMVAGGTTDGACTALVPSVAAVTMCRPSIGGCDTPELCGASMACPADVISPAGATCRASAGACDVADVCDGTSGACPDVLVAGDTICRDSTGACDAAEVCDGSTAGCPGDALLPAGTVCGVGMGDCATPGACTGSSPSCPSLGVRPAGTVCRPASGACDEDDVCDGTSDACPAVFADVTTLCGTAPTEPCDAPDHCAGTSADCVDVFLAGTECRAATAPCDAPELCSGGGPACPPDVVVSAGLTCRGSTESCDPEEVCDGTSTSCPADVTSCARDAGSTDGGPVVDPGPPAAAGGCGCRASSGSPSILVLALAVVLAFVRRRVRS